MDEFATLTMSEIALNFGPLDVLTDFHLSVLPGSIVALVGPNGSGKSSALSIAAGILEPSAGITAIGGLRRRDDLQAYARRVGYVPQEPALYDELTPLQNLQFFGQMLGLCRSSINEQIALAAERFRLRDFLRKPVHSLSGGMKQRVNLACALLHDPQLFILDEPTAAIDARSRRELFEILHDIRDTGTAILMSSHLWF